MQEQLPRMRATFTAIYAPLTRPSPGGRGSLLNGIRKDFVDGVLGRPQWRSLRTDRTSTGYCTPNPILSFTGGLSESGVAGSGSEAMR